MKTCKSCGAKIEDGQRYCPNCGAPVPPDATETSANAAQSPQQHAAAIPAPAPKAPRKAATRRQARGIYICIPIILLIFIAAVAFFSYRFISQRVLPNSNKINTQLKDAAQDVITVEQQEIITRDDGSKAANITVTIPDFVALYADAAVQPDPSQYLLSMLKSEDVPTVQCETTVGVASENDIPNEESDNFVRKTMENEMIDAINAAAKGE